MNFKRNALKKYDILHNRYLIEGMLGQGGSGFTYQALDMLEDTYVAIKECMPYGKAYREEGMKNIIFLNDNFKEMQFELYKNEAAILKELLELTEVVSFKEFLHENNTCYIIMEYFEGTTLEEMVKNSDETRLHSYINLLKPVIECLGLIHERGVIHRDICPENILISSNQELRIIDFGSAVDFNRCNSENVLTPTYRKGFSSPEQYSTEYDLGSWSDVYSICATIYYCVTKSTPPDAVNRIQSFDVSTFELFKKGNMRSMIENGMALNSRDRWKKAEDILKGFFKS